MARLDFANAKLGARRARLLGAGALRDLLARPTLEARLDLLRELPIGACLPQPLPGADPLAAAEAALREAVRREGVRIAAAAEGAPARALLGAFLALAEAAAVKAILRGVAAGARIDRVLAGAPALPGLPEPLLRRAASARTVEEALALLAPSSDVARAAQDALSPGARGLGAAEIAADRAAFGRALAACRRRGEDAAVLAGHLADQVDARNARTLLLLGGEPPARDPWIPGGRRLDEPAFRALSRAAPGALRLALARAFRCRASELERPGTADRAIERAVARTVRREARRRPLSLAVPLAYLADREAEVRSVAVVLRGAEMGVAGEEILDLAGA